MSPIALFDLQIKSFDVAALPIVSFYTLHSPNTILYRIVYDK